MWYDFFWNLGRLDEDQTMLFDSKTNAKSETILNTWFSSKHDKKWSLNIHDQQHQILDEQLFHKTKSEGT